jgi:hypothetical protein
MKWQDVFKAAVKKANELRSKDPKLSYPQAVKKAWKDPEILKKKLDYNKNHKVAPKPAAKKPKKPATKKKPAKK